MAFLHKTSIAFLFCLVSVSTHAGILDEAILPAIKSEEWETVINLIADHWDSLTTEDRNRLFAKLDSVHPTLAAPLRQSDEGD